MRNRSRRSVGPQKPTQTDVWALRLTLLILGISVIVVILGAILLTVLGKVIPEPLTVIGSASIGALGGLFLPGPHRR